MSTDHFDLVVVGAGFAGLIAANRAAQLGLSVCLVEKGIEGDYACNSRIATGVISVAHGNPRRSPGELLQAIVDDSEGYADPNLAKTLATTVERAMLWLHREGVKIIKVTMGGRPRWILAPPVPLKPGEHWLGRGPDQALRRLARNLRRRGGTIRFETRAIRLLDHDGSCVGIEIEGQNGRSEIRAPRTILADGGFQANHALLARFVSPAPEKLLQRNALSGSGDAVQMAEQLGAKLVGMDAFYGHLMAHDAMHRRDLWPYPTIDSLASSAIVVNRDGKRFLDEGAGGIPMANSIAKLADPLEAVAVFDDEQWKEAGAAELLAPNPYLEKLGGAISCAPSVPALAEQLGISREVLTSTVSDYNRAVKAGMLGALKPARTPGRYFGQPRASEKRIEPTPIERPPFRAIRLCAGISYTLGGLAIDSQTRVLSTGNGVVPGLFAAGSTTGGLEGGPLPGYLGGLLKAFCFGLVSGEAVADHQVSSTDEKPGFQLPTFCERAEAASIGSRLRKAIRW